MFSENWMIVYNLLRFLWNWRNANWANVMKLFKLFCICAFDVELQTIAFNHVYGRKFKVFHFATWECDEIYLLLLYDTGWHLYKQNLIYKLISNVLTNILTPHHTTLRYMYTWIYSRYRLFCIVAHLTVFSFFSLGCCVCVCVFRDN